MAMKRPYLSGHRTAFPVIHILCLYIAIYKCMKSGHSLLAERTVIQANGVAWRRDTMRIAEAERSGSPGMRWSL